MCIRDRSTDEKRKLAAAIKKEEAEAKLAAAKGTNKLPNVGKNNRTSAAPFGNSVGVGAGGTSSNFFAYNDKALKKGRRDFERQWPGRNSAEDNWRRSNRPNISINDDIADVSSYEESLTDEEITKMLAGVPNTDAEKQKANDNIMTSLFQLGSLYRDRLKNNEKAVETLELLNQRYPGGIHELESWYFLYLAHSDLGNNTQ